MDINDLDLKLRNGISILFSLLVFFLPLLLWTNASEVFELPKMFFVYAMMTIIVILWLMRMVVTQKILLRSTPLDIPILLFLLSQVISTIYSIDPHTSWFGYYSRFHGGLLSTISYTLLYYALVNNVGNRKQEIRNNEKRRNLEEKPRSLFLVSCSLPLSSVLASAVVVSLYAILQRFGVDRDFWVQDVISRVFSTLGQPNWLAGYIVMVLPITYALGITNLHKSPPISTNNKRRPHVWSLVPIGHWYLLIIGLLFLALLFTRSRSGLIGLGAADLIFWSLIFFQAHLGKNKLENVVKPFLLIHVLLAGLILATNNPLREILLNQNNKSTMQQSAITPALESGITLRKSQQGGTESGDIRRLVWTGAWELTKRYPLFGTGPETFAYTYWWVRPVEHNLTSEWNFLYNKAHNEWLSLAANTGLFGLGSHLLLLGWFGVWILKQGTRAEGQGLRDKELQDKLRLTNAAILAAILGVETVNVFGFSTVTTGAYSYLFMAMAVGVSNATELPTLYSQQDDHRRVRKRSTVIMGVLAVLGLYSLVGIALRFYADLSYRRGQAYAESGYVTDALTPLQTAVDLVPAEPVFRAELAEAEGLLASSLSSRLGDTTPANDISQEDVETLKNEALRNFKIVYRESPKNLGFIKSQARTTFAFGVIDPKFYDEGLTMNREAMTLAPTDPKLPYTHALMLRTLGRDGEAREYLEKAIELKPDYEEAKKALQIYSGIRG